MYWMESLYKDPERKYEIFDNGSRIILNINGKTFHSNYGNFKDVLKRANPEIQKTGIDKKDLANKLKEFNPVR